MMAAATAQKRRVNLSNQEKKTVYETKRQIPVLRGNLGSRRVYDDDA